MGANVKQIKNRIKSIDSTLHLTKAMELVASSKIRRAREAYFRAESYKNAFRNVLGSLARSPEFLSSAFTRGNAAEGNDARGQKIKLIVIAGDRGLAGGYNGNVFKLASTVEAAEIIPIGKRAADRFNIAGSRCEAFTVRDCAALSNRLLDEFLAGGYDKLLLISTGYISAMRQEASLETLLPFMLPKISDENRKAAETVFEPDPETVFRAVLPEYLSSVIYSAVRESFLSEVTARRFAMDSACRNAEKMLDELTLSFNRARQGAITQEITEIIAGSGQ